MSWTCWSVWSWTLPSWFHLSAVWCCSADVAWWTLSSSSSTSSSAGQQVDDGLIQHPLLFWHTRLVGISGTSSRCKCDRSGSVTLCILLWWKKLPPMTRLLEEQKSANISPLSIISNLLTLIKVCSSLTYAHRMSMNMWCEAEGKAHGLYKTTTLYVFNMLIFFLCVCCWKRKALREELPSLLLPLLGTEEQAAVKRTKTGRGQIRSLAKVCHSQRAMSWPC